MKFLSSMYKALMKVLTGELIDLSKIPKFPAESLLNPTDAFSLAAYLLQAVQVNVNNFARRGIILALIGAHVSIGLILWRSPELWRWWIAAGMFGTIICSQLEAVRCRGMVRHANAGRAIELRVPGGVYGTFFDTLDLHFSRFKLTMGEWFCFISWFVWLGTWASYHASV